jgi:hypothetical protein
MPNELVNGHGGSALVTPDDGFFRTKRTQRNSRAEVALYRDEANRMDIVNRANLTRQETNLHIERAQGAHGVNMAQLEEKLADAQTAAAKAKTVLELTLEKRNVIHDALRDMPKDDLSNRLATLDALIAAARR